MVIFDEAHKLSAFKYGKKKYFSERYKVAQMLSSRCEHMLLLTATPHRGRRDTFKFLLQLLDDDIFAHRLFGNIESQRANEDGVSSFSFAVLKKR